jgi:putative tryptophan/tyrosine transport system substrate-binding protein
MRLGIGVLAGAVRAAGAAEKLPVIGVLWHAANAEEEAPFRGPLRDGFVKLGYIDGKNIVFEDRYPAEDPERFERLAVELVALKVDVLVAASIPSALAAQRATKTIPIVFVVNPDPVGLKLVASLAHPGGNITGQSTVAYELAAKRVEILKEAIPGLARFALLVNPNIPLDKPRLLQEMQPATDKFGLVAEVVEADQPEKLDRVFREMVDRKTGAVIVSQNPMFFIARQRIADLALKFRIPAMVPADLFVEAGALLSYGPAWPPLFRNAATFVDKILKGAKPADLPVEQPTVFELTINRKTADALGIALPGTLLARADRVIE